MPLYLLSEPREIRSLLRDDVTACRRGIANQSVAPFFKHGLFFVEGAAWRTRRDGWRGALKQQAIDDMLPAVRAHAERFCQTLGRQPGDEIIDLYAHVRRITVEIATSNLVGNETLAEGPDWMEDIDALWRYAGSNVSPIERLFSSDRAEFRRRLARVGDAVDRHIASMTSAAKPAAGLLGALSAVEGIDARALRDEAMTLLFTAHECSALATAAALQLASSDQAVWTRMSDEVFEQVGNRPVEAVDLRRLPYSRMVLNEALRLFPPGWVFARQLNETREVCGSRLPRNAIVLMSPFVVHHDAKHWPDPERFDPERFDRTRRDERTQSAFLPFGTGPRTCVGMGLAVMQALTIMVTVLQRFDLRAAGTAMPAPNPGLTLRPASGFPVTLQPRQP